MSSLIRFLGRGFVPLTLALMVSVVAQAQEERGGRDGQRGGDRQGQDGGQRGPGGFRGGPGGGPGFGGRGGFGGGPGGGIDKPTLVGIKQVQDELQIGGDQMIFVNEVLGEYREKSRELFTGLGNIREMSEEDREKAFAGMREKREKLVKEAEEGLATFLDKDQARRLDEISIRVRGINALSDAQVAGKLALSEQQQTQIKDAFAAAAEERQKAFDEMRAQGGFGQGGQNGERPSPEAMRERMEAMRTRMEAMQKQQDEKVLAVLTADQKKQFEAMQGRPFELDRGAVFGGGAFGGGRGGRPGGEGDAGGRPRRPDGEGDRPARPAAE